MTSIIEQSFDRAMLDIYRRAKTEAGYNASRFLSMISENGGLATARTLLHSESVSDGYTALWERQRLDLTVEFVVLDVQWSALFTDAERSIATKRLREYGYSGSLPVE